MSFAVVRMRGQSKPLLERALAGARLVRIERLRLPDLEEAAAPDEGGDPVDRRVARQRRRQHDAALAVEEQLAGVAEQRGRQVVVLVGEETDLADPLVEVVDPVDAGALHRRVFEGRSGHDAVDALPLQRHAERRRHRHAALAVDLVGEGAKKQSHRAPCRFPLIGPGLACCRRVRPDSRAWPAGRILPGSWDIMGYYGRQWESGSKAWEFQGVNGSLTSRTNHEYETSSVAAKDSSKGQAGSSGINICSDFVPGASRKRWRGAMAN